MAASCVRVDPPFVEFNDVNVGQVYETKVTVTNVGKTLKKIVIERPGLGSFNFTASTSACVVAPGLSVGGMLEFIPEEEKEVTDCLLIHVDDVETIEVPLRGFPRACSLHVDSTLDFGCIAATGVVITKNHLITNQGSAPGAFHVEYNGDPTVTLAPRSGVIAAGATQWLKVEMRADRPKLIAEEALVKLQNRSDVVVSIRAHVVNQRLEISDLRGAPLPCLRFGATYFGTSCVGNVVLRNNSPQACEWVCLLQNAAAGTEAGTRLQRSADATLVERTERRSPATQDASKVLLCIPEMGSLGPYEKTIVAVCFSPTCNSKTKRWKHSYTASRRDYRLFLLFESLESRYGFTHRDGDGSVELAVTGSGLPVSLLVSPSERLHFHVSAMGQRVDLLCVLQNLCPQLPVNFSFRKTAHFTTTPSTGKIPPRQSQDVVLAFVAQRQGRFRVHQKLDVLGHVVRRPACATEGAAKLERCTCHTVTLHLSSVCRSDTTHPVPKPNPGTTPALTKPTRPQPHGRQVVYAAAFRASKTQLHVRHSQDAEADELRAFPKVGATNIRPTSARKQSRRWEKVDNSVDIGIVPAQGLVPPTLRIRDLETSNIPDSGPDSSPASPATRRDAVPSTSHEVADYHRALTPMERYQVQIGPLFVDFGEVCVHSVCVQEVELINNLSAFVWVQLEVDCPELRGSSPLAHALPPHSRSALPLTFQSDKLGPFYRPVSFSVNHRHPGQIVVQAQVVPLALELSTTSLVLCPAPTLLAKSGYRSSVTLRNRRNHPAEFTWRPVVPDCGILFSIRPAAGTVEPYRELDCDVVWHSSFSSPPLGGFHLFVREGNTQHLQCVAKVGSTSVVLAEQRILFGSVPLNMPSVRTAVLHNTGQNHAFYQVADVCPLPGMAVSPAEGAVPIGGQAELEIRFNPDSVIRFDTTVKIALKGMKSIKLRVGGSVEPPNVDISVSHFQFGGVYVGSHRAIPFSLANLSPAPARLTLDLSAYPDFSLQLPQPSAEKDRGVTVAEIQSNQTMDCSLVFSPTQVTGYDFDLPLTVNGVRWPAGSLSLTPLSDSAPPPDGAVKRLSVSAAAPRSHGVQATALFAPLELSPSCLQFHMDPLCLQCDTYTKTVELSAVREESAFWRAGARERVSWRFDCHARAASTEDGGGVELCSVSPSSGSLGPGQSVCLEVSVSLAAIRTGPGRVNTLLLPLHLGDEGGERMGGETGRGPYRELSITVALQPPRIDIRPRRILLPPVPLGSDATATVILLAAGYPRGTSVSAEVDDIFLEDGTKVEPVSVLFPEGNNIPSQQLDRTHPSSIQNQEANAASLICRVSFCSALPLSICTAVTFTDHLHSSCKVELCAAAENCMLTVWPSMGPQRCKQQIVLRPGATAVGAILDMHPTPGPASAPTSSSSSMFDGGSSRSKGSASGSSGESDSVSSQAAADISPNRDIPANLGVPEFPAPDSDQGLYYQDVLLAVERWFSFFGWPGGPHPIAVPHTLRRVASEVTYQPVGRTRRVTQSKDSRSVADMLHHLAGGQIPGVPRCQAFSGEVDRRTQQLLQQHEATLAFLRVQGAFLCHVKPEHLLDVQEFEHWRSLQSAEEEPSPDYSGVDYESLSKRAWTDLLMQTYKVLVLRRVSESRRNTSPDGDAGREVAPFTSQPLASNVYSRRELRLLSWLNARYRSMRTVVWGTGTGGVPSERWVVNFDLDLTDGLVLAALLASFCPYLTRSHFQRMYTTAGNLEQVLHNNVIVCQALTALRLNLDVQPTDLSDPNPVQMLMLCVHLYERLPDYLPRQTTTLSGRLRSAFSKQGRPRLRGDFDGVPRAFALRGAGGPPPPADHVALRCPVGQTRQTQLDVPNWTQNKVTLEVVTDLSALSGAASLEIKPGHKAPYLLSVSPWKRGKQTGHVIFREADDGQKENKPGNVQGRYEVRFSVEIICEPAAPVKVINVRCSAQSSVAIEIPVSNPRGEPQTLDVRLEGDDLSGASSVSVPPGETLAYKATFSPGRAGKSSGSVLFQSELTGEFWYQLQLYALPPPITSLPPACCQLGKSTRQTVPLVNPTAEPLELLVVNSNPRNFAVEQDPGRALTVAPHSSVQLGVLFTPSSIGEGRHMAKISFTCPELQEWCVLLSGRGLHPDIQEPLRISCRVGSSASVAVPVTNPTEVPVVLDVALADEDPSGAAASRQVAADRRAFSIPLSLAEGVRLGEGAGLDVPVAFTPGSGEPRRARLCVAMSPAGTAPGDDARSTVRWVYPLHGIPL